MCDAVKGLIAKCWKDEPLDLATGRHYFDETIAVRITGTVERQADQLVAPTTSIPLVATLALFWQKCGVTRDHALRLLREAITEALKDGADKDERIKSYILDCEAAVQAVKDELISKLPKAKRAGRIVTKDLRVELVPAHEEEGALATAAA